MSEQDEVGALQREASKMLRDQLTRLYVLDAAMREEDARVAAEQDAQMYERCFGVRPSREASR